MPIEFYCSQCRNRLRVADSAAGKEAQCPVCGAIVAVPAGAAGYPPYTPGAVGPKTSASGEGIAPVPPIPPEALARPVPPGNAPGPPPGVGPQPAWYGAQFTPYSATPVTSSEQGRQESWGVHLSFWGYSASRHGAAPRSASWWEFSRSSLESWRLPEVERPSESLESCWGPFASY